MPRKTKANSEPRPLSTTDQAVLSAVEYLQGRGLFGIKNLEYRGSLLTKITAADSEGVTYVKFEILAPTKIFYYPIFEPGHLTEMKGAKQFFWACESAVYRNEVLATSFNGMFLSGFKFTAETSSPDPLWSELALSSLRYCLKHIRQGIDWNRGATIYIQPEALHSEDACKLYPEVGVWRSCKISSSGGRCPIITYEEPVSKLDQACKVPSGTSFHLTGMW